VLHSRFPPATLPSPSAALHTPPHFLLAHLPAPATLSDPPSRSASAATAPYSQTPTAPCTPVNSASSAALARPRLPPRPLHTPPAALRRARPPAPPPDTRAHCRDSPAHSPLPRARSGNPAPS